MICVNVAGLLCTIIFVILVYQSKRNHNYLDPSIKILDFWGEGRVYDLELGLITGFNPSDAYNVNRIGNTVSNGINKGKRIPNLIPTKSYEDVDISAYIPDSSFQYITVMGAPVTENVAKEIYRVLKKDETSMIVLYGLYADVKEFIQIIEENMPNSSYTNSSSVRLIEGLPELLKEPRFVYDKSKDFLDPNYVHVIRLKRKYAVF